VVETFEFRLAEEAAAAILGDDVGQRLGPGGLARVGRLAGPGPTWDALRAAEGEARKQGRTVLTYWDVRREYTPAELSAASLLQLLPTTMFEPSAEETGTVYDYSQACPICGAGRRQVSELILDLRKAPRKADFAFTIARDENIVSKRLAEMVQLNALTGARFRSVRPLEPMGDQQRWLQLAFESAALETASPTKFGMNPLIGPEPRTCPPGHVAGQRILTELFIDRRSWDGSDWNRTNDLVGARRGLVAPYPLIVVSQRCWTLLRQKGFTGFDVEVAHVV